MNEDEEIMLYAMPYYRKALRDVYNWFEAHSDSIKHYNLGNYACMLELMQEMMMNPEPLMEQGGHAEYKGGDKCRDKIKKKQNQIKLSAV